MALCENYIDTLIRKHFWVTLSNLIMIMSNQKTSNKLRF